jgi:SpoVK/Ycf46/Vps4 family AAA+-type ATPase
MGFFSNILTQLALNAAGILVILPVPTLKYNPFFAPPSSNDRTDDVIPMDDEPSGQDDKGSEQKKTDYTSRKAMDDMLNESLDSAVVGSKTKVMWKDIAGLATAIKELQIAAALPLRFPNLFTDKREPPRFILLYGPPGTSKGQLIKALASEVVSTLFTISSSDIESKWCGESGRSVSVLQCYVYLLARINSQTETDGERLLIVG